jgi:hypothetical protein
MDAADPVVLKTTVGDLAFSPIGVPDSSSDALRVSDDAALWTGTGHSSDQLVKIVPDGFESFTTVLDAQAAEAYRWRLSLTDSQHLVLAPDGGVLVLDRDAAVPVSDDARPRGERLAPAPSANAREEAQRAATEGSSADGLGAAIRGTDAPALYRPAAGMAGAVDMQQAADGLAALSDASRKARTESKTELAQLSADNHEFDVQIDRVNERNHRQDEALIAVVSAPEAKDADGKSVPSRLTVDGDVITLHVAHRDAGVAYPVVADPYVSVTYPVEKTGERPVMATETYVSGWTLVQVEGGVWNFMWCTDGVICNNHGDGWWDVHVPSNGTYLDYAVYQDDGWWSHYVYVGQPVYSTRQVQVGWETYTYIENVTEDVYVPDSWDELSETPVSFALDPAYADLAPDPDFEVGEVEARGMSTDDYFVVGDRTYARKDCRRTHDVEDIEAPIGLGSSLRTRMATSKMDTNFCWNQTKKKAAYNGAVDLMAIDLSLAVKWKALGLKATIYGDPRMKMPMEWNGGSQGQIKMERWMDLEACTPVIKLGCLMSRQYRHTTYGHWDGTARAEVRLR